MAEAVIWPTKGNLQWHGLAKYHKQRHALSQVLTPDATVISCGWNSCGMGQKYGMEIIELLLVAHGGAHNDTIVTVERKVETAQTGLFTEPRAINRRI